MRKKILLCMVVLTGLTSFAGREHERTLLLVPREDGAIRVGLDIANRYPTLLLSYKQHAGGPVSLHGWTGKEWVNVTMDAYVEGQFFREGPDTAVLVETTDFSVPEGLVPSELWCRSVYKISTIKTRPLLHLIGQYYDFKFKDWQWFSKNYHLPVEAINPEGLNISWYHQRLTEHLKNKPSVHYDDLQYWSVLRQPVAEPELQPETDSLVDAAPELMVATNAPVANPLTNEVPEAVIVIADAISGADTATTNAPSVETTEPAP